jgi:hypothetical protein
VPEQCELRLINIGECKLVDERGFPRGDDADDLNGGQRRFRRWLALEDRMILGDLLCEDDGHTGTNHLRPRVFVPNLERK